MNDNELPVCTIEQLGQTLKDHGEARVVRADGETSMFVTNRLSPEAEAWPGALTARDTFDPTLVRALLLEISQTKFGAGWESLLAAAKAVAESEKKA